MWLTPDERHVPRHRQRLGRRHADEERPDQTRPDRAGDRVDALLVDACFDDRASDHRIEHVEVRPRSDLRHHTAEVGVQIDLGGHHTRHDVVAAEHQ